MPKKRNLKTLFRRRQWKELLIFMFFVLLSFGFWMLQNLRQDFEHTIKLPVRYRNVKSEIKLSDNLPKSLTILLKDKGTSLFYYSWKSNFLPVDISVSDIIESGDSVPKVTRQMLETAISKQLLSSTSIISVEPSSFPLSYDSLTSKTVKVVPDLQITTKQGFQISDSILVEPAEIEVFATKSILDTLNEVHTKLVNLDNLSKNKEITAHLRDYDNAKFNVESVKLFVPVEEYTEKRLQLDICCNDVPEEFVLRILPPSVEVVCNIPISKFKELTENVLEIQILFEEFQNNQSLGRMPLRLTQKPSWVNSFSIVPYEVEFIIEQNNK